jgi:uncharacterized protein involved in exopolysaccharide biosynthesis
LDRARHVEEISPLEPTVLGAMWRYRWLVLASVAGAAVLSLVFAGTRPTEYEASASLVVEDPRASGVFQTLVGVRPERYVADQVEILRSTVVAQRASELSAEELASEESPSLDDILDNAVIFGDSDSNLIEIRYRATDPSVAQVAADSIALAYRDVQRSADTGRAAAALERLDASLAEIDTELGRIQTRITALQPGAEFRSELETRRLVAAVPGDADDRERGAAGSGDGGATPRERGSDRTQGRACIAPRRNRHRC